MTIRILDAALLELRRAAKRYRIIRPELGAKFKEAAEAALDRIERRPLTGAPTDRNARICKLRRFPYGFIYVALQTEIVVVAVMHLHRRPGYWKRRLKDLGP
jgi:hypothetical protein